MTKDNSTAILRKLLPFVKESGQFALANQSQVDFYQSPLKSQSVWDVVTTTDLEISRRCHEFINQNFSDLDYLIVEEETAAQLGTDPMTSIKQHEYLFIIDPLDGTLTYSSGLPFFGINVAVFHQHQPLLGIIYLPALDLLLYGDHSGAFQESKNTTEPLIATDKPKPLFATSFLAEDHCDGRYSPLSLYSAAANSTYVLTGQLSCWDFGAYLWDIAPAYAIAQHLNISTYNFFTGKPIDLFAKNTFNEKLKSRDVYLFCRPAQLPDFQKLLRPISGL